MSDNNTPPGKYNVHCIEENEIGELFTAEITNEGVYLDHNWVDGCLYLSHEEFEELDSFREEFLGEIS